MNSLQPSPLLGYTTPTAYSNGNAGMSEVLSLEDLLGLASKPDAKLRRLFGRTHQGMGFIRQITHFRSATQLRKRDCQAADLR